MAKYFSSFFFTFSLFAGDPVVPGGNSWSQNIVGCTIEWINPYNTKGYSVGDRVLVIDIDSTQPWLANLQDGKTIHSDWLNINYVIRFTPGGEITDRIHNETLYFGHLFSQQFPSSGEKPQFGIIHSVKPYAHWDTSLLDQVDRISGGTLHFKIPEPIFIAHNIPNHAFKIGFDTYRLLEFKKFNTLQGNANNGDYLIPELSIKNFHTTPNPGNRIWDMVNFTGEFVSPKFIRLIYLRYQAKFSVEFWDGNKGTFDLNFEEPVYITTQYE